MHPIRVRREALDMTQEELAEKAGVTSGNAVSKMEAGIRQPKANEIPGLCSVLGLTPKQLLGEEPLTGLAEPEAVYVPEPELAAAEPAVARLLYPEGRADTMVVKAPTLILEGYAPGDHILVDGKREPKPGDCVVAQVYCDETGSSEIVLRVFDPPFLIPSTHEGRRFETYLMTDQVKVMGVIVNRYKPPEHGRAA